MRTGYVLCGPLLLLSLLFDRRRRRHRSTSQIDFLWLVCLFALLGVLCVCVCVDVDWVSQSWTTSELVPSIERKSERRKRRGEERESWKRWSETFQVLRNTRSTYCRCSHSPPCHRTPYNNVIECYFSDFSFKYMHSVHVRRSYSDFAVDKDELRRGKSHQKRSSPSLSSNGVRSILCIKIERNGKRERKNLIQKWLIANIENETVFLFPAWPGTLSIVWHFFFPIYLSFRHSIFIHSPYGSVSYEWVGHNLRRV